jgi:hypothetical protein
MQRPHRPAPFKPSFLSYTSAPFSPALPLTPPINRPCSPPPIIQPSATTTKAHVPARPLPWLWTCHQCGTTYPLAATRRCLQDGHFFCSGSTYSTRTGRTRRHRSCSSEFDYMGWTKMAEWRLSTQSTAPITHQKDCWKNCDYPSECRWGAHDHQGETEDSIPAFTTTEEGPSSTQMDCLPASKKDTIVEQVVAAVQESQRQDQQAQRNISTLAPIAEEPSPPTSPLRQHYILPGLNFPSPPSTTPAPLTKSRSSPSLSTLIQPTREEQRWMDRSSSFFSDEDDDDYDFDSDSETDLESDDSTSESDTSSPFSSPPRPTSSSSLPSSSSSTDSREVATATAAPPPIFGLFVEDVDLNVDVNLNTDIEMTEACAFGFASPKSVAGALRLLDRVVDDDEGDFEDVKMDG